MTDHNSEQNAPDAKQSLEPVSEDTQELTSYLDGELTPAQMQAVEDRLATDEHYRKEMQQLQKAWDMLDQLPRADSSAQFTKSTIEMVVYNATHEVRKKKNLMVTWITRVAMLAGLPLAAFGSSQFVTQHIQNAPWRELAQDLPLIENVDIYEKAESIDFLSGLSELPLFNNVEMFEISDLAVDYSAKTSTSIRRREQLDAQELDELRKKKKRFDELSLDAQESLRELRRKLIDHQDSQALTATMLRYYSWLGMLDEKNDLIPLLDLPVQLRLERVREMTEQRAGELLGKTRSTQLPENDASVVYSWIKTTQRIHYQELIDRFRQLDAEELALIQQTEPRRTQRTNGPDQDELEKQRIRRAITKVDPKFVGNLIFKEIEELRGELSQEAMDILDRFEGEEQRNLLLNWIVTATRLEQHVPEATLREFYDKELTPERRDEFDQMSPTTFRDELLYEYHRTRQSPDLPPSLRRDKNEHRERPRPTGT